MQLHARGIPCVSATRAPATCWCGRAQTALARHRRAPEIDRARLAVAAARRAPDVPLLRARHGRVEAEGAAGQGRERSHPTGARSLRDADRHALATLGLRRARHRLSRALPWRDERPTRARRRSARCPRFRELALRAGACRSLAARARIRERFGVPWSPCGAPTAGLQSGAETILRPGDIVRVFGLPEQIAGVSLRKLRASGGAGRRPGGDAGAPRDHANRRYGAPVMGTDS